MNRVPDLNDRSLVIVGVGLIGASLGLALKAAGHRGEIVGTSRSSETLETALTLGVVDRVEAELTDAVRDAAMVVLTTPMLAMPPLLQALATAAPADAVITDGGSVKSSFVDAARDAFADSLWRVVPGHPIAGREHSGVEAGEADLYAGRRVILTPLAESDDRAVAAVQRVWQACGAEVVSLPVERHDGLLAATSHLPHYAAFALVDMLAARADRDDIFRFAAGGFRDFTRVASSDPTMWRDIALCNRDAIVGELDAYVDALSQLRDRVAAGDGDALSGLFTRARDARNAWLNELDDTQEPSE
ncbi:MAG: prephenate dehydrogenase/arogenate dehydrogenase family protein [Pseudomonadota bacterium]